MLKQSIIALDKKVFGGKIKNWYTRVFILGSYWDDFIKKIKKLTSHGKAILDIGAGEAEWRKHFKNNFYVAIDKMIGEPWWNYRNLDIVGNALTLPIKDETFHTVLSIHVMEHMHSPLTALQEIHRSLKRGGYLFIATNQSWHQHQKPYDFYRYTSFGLKYLLQESGFVVENVCPMGGYFTHLRYILSFGLQFLNLRGLGILMGPLRFIINVLINILMAPVLFYLDKIDKKKDMTIGYFCCAKKV